MYEPIYRPCKRYKHMRLTPRFEEHLPKCDACKAVIAYLDRELQVFLYFHTHRN